MPTLSADPSQGLSRSLVFLFKSDGPTPFNSYPMRPDFPVNEMKSILFHGYNGIHHAVPPYITHAAPMTAARESLDLEAQHENFQQVTNTDNRPRTTPLHPHRNINSHSTPETDNSATESDQPDGHGEYDFHKKSSILPKRTRVWMATFVVGVISLTVVPGLVVGVMTRQMSWGVELSGAIAPIVSLLAGLYYHTQK